MKLLLLALFSTALLFSGGEFLPVDKVSKYEKMEQAFNTSKLIPIEKASGTPTSSGCTYRCGKPATLLPYLGEDIPLAITFPCPFNDCVKNLS